MSNRTRIAQTPLSPARRAALVPLVAGALLGVAPAAPAADAHTFTAVADTYVDAGRPRATFGASPRLHASPASERTYLRFRVRGVGGGIARATLLLWSTGGRRALVEVRRAHSNRWSESTAFANAPAVRPGSPRARGFAARGWTAVDVTRLVKRNGVVTLVVTPASSGVRLAFRSRESRVPAQLRVRAKTPVKPKDTQPTPPPPPAPTPPPPAPTPPPPAPANVFQGRVGMAGATVWYSADKQLSYLLKMRAAGLTQIREDFHWGAFEPSPGVWDWTVGDRLMRNASLAGVDVLGVIAYSAGWAASGATIYHPPKDPAQYAAFCAALVKRYGPGGAFWAANPALAPRPLAAVEIWNEPWLHQFWRPNPDPAGYVRLVRAAATAIRAANPQVKILASGDIFQMRNDTTASLDWFRLLLENDAAVFRTLVDAYSIHPYVQARSPRDTVQQQRWRFDRALMTRDLAAAAGASHPLWITEFGWTTNTSDSAGWVTEPVQASYTQEALEIAFKEWPSGLVEKAFLYYWGDSSDAFSAGYSPLRADGSPKPLWTTLAGLLG